MAFCSGCGNEVGSETGFCPKCGKPVASGAASPPPPAAAGSGLQENAAGLLCYVLGWLTGLIFFLIDKRPFVRFHAMQSIITFGALHVLVFVLAMLGFAGGFMGGMGFGMMMGGAWWLVYSLFNLAVLVVWILCMVKAYQGQHFKLPIIGNIAENYSK